MDAKVLRFILRLIRSALIILSILSFFDYLQDSKFLKTCPEYSIYKYFLFTKIALLFTILSSISGIIHRISGYRVFLNSFFLAAATCFETVVFVVFWFLYFFDKSLIVDKKALKAGMEASILNRLASHAFPLILSYLNIHDLSLKYNSADILAFFIFGGFYFIATDYYSLTCGKNFYPFLDKMTQMQRGFFFLCACVFMTLIYLINVKFLSRSETKSEVKKLN